MFAAILMRGSRAAPQELATGEALLAAMMPFAKPDKQGVWQGDHAIVAQALWHNTPESLHEHAPETCPETGRVIASWMRLDNRAELCAELGLQPRATLTDPQIVLVAHRRWGRDCAARLEGDFSFVIYDPARHEAWCARDAIGAKPLYYILTDEHFVAATSVAVMRVLTGQALAPSREWIALFASVLNFAHTQAAYEEVKKLPSAHDLLIVREGTCEPREFFAFDLAAPHATRRDVRWVERYRDAFDRAVADRARSHFLIGAEATGGLDSSSVIASLAERLPHDRDDFHTFAMIAMEDEPETVMACAAMCDIRHTHVLMQPRLLRVDAAFDRALATLGHPPEHGQPLVYPEFFEWCGMLGIRTLFSGFGGDEVATSYAKPLIDELHARGEYRAMLDELGGSLPRRLVRLARRLKRGPEDPDLAMRQLIATKLDVACLRRDFVEDSGLAQQLEEWVCPERSELTLNTLAGLYPGFRLGRQGRLESSVIYAASYGMDYRFPLLDRRLIQQFFATPSIEKRRRDMGRYLHRRAVAGRIPDRIAWQVGKSMGGFIGGRPPLEDPPAMAFEELPDVLRSIIDPAAFADTAQALHRSRDRFEDSDMRRRMYFWQLRQVSIWLDETR
ncbi:asparagine synthase-related protein [Erythrobacter sp. JK5]|uniref:asparagine synthase-related protein n=1 Tax=Erythrobacter sp. JK5 TaxID=2829500 RepID=UPI001BA8CC26|nr:asparagine synthase-related protein [Erythrobacter sp. JK5]QUL37817.1 hypothetical protein KDC96_16060 [Erythrobacter sp. JK5]